MYASAMSTNNATSDHGDDVGAQGKADLPTNLLEHDEDRKPAAVASALEWQARTVSLSGDVTNSVAKEMEVVPAIAGDSPPNNSADMATGAAAARLIDLAMEKLEDSLKAEYLEAKRRSPKVVEKESNPTQFLAFAEQDADAAARRLAAYWKKRIAIFGEKGYLMIEQTGEGALGRGDMTLLSGGFLVLLPESDTGLPVICYDGSRLSKAAKNCQLRVAFYWLKLVAEHPKSLTEGFVILHLIDKLVTNTRDKRQCIGDILRVFPIRIKAIHGIPMDSIRATDKSIGFAVNKLFGKSPTGKVISYANVPQESLAQTLRSHGISEDIAPKSIGGSWGYEDFVRWQELRTRYEWDLPPGPGNKDAIHLFDFSNVRNLGDMNEEEKIERKRRMNVLHSRRKRERERIEIEVLQEQCAEYEHKNKLISQDNLRMENLMESARTKVARLEQGQASVARFPSQSVSSVLSSLGIASAPVARSASLGNGSSGLAALTGGATAPGLEALLLQQIQQQRLGAAPNQMQQQAESSSALQRMQLRHAAEQRQLQETILLQRSALANPTIGIFTGPVAVQAPQLYSVQQGQADNLAARSILSQQGLASILASQQQGQSDAPSQLPAQDGDQS